MNLKPVIEISLKPHLEDFLRKEFRVSKNGELVLTRRHDIGKFIVAQVLTSDLPVKRPFRSNLVKLILPLTKKNQYSLTRNFLYISKWGEEKISDYLESEFRRRVRDMFER